MAIVNGYATLDEFDAWIGEDLVDAGEAAVREQAVESASRWIDGHCDRQFWPEPGQPRTFDACGRWELRIDDASEVLSVATDDDHDGTYETDWDAADWQAIPNPGTGPEQRPYRRIRSVNGRSFPLPRRRVGLVQVTANWGWPAIPDAVHQACLIQAARVLKRRNSPEGVTGFGNEFGLMRVTAKGDPDVTALLAPYRMAVLVA